MRICLIGAGFIGRVHLAAAKSVPALEVVGVVDPHARQDHPDLRGLSFYDSLTAMLRTERLDGAIVAVPDQFHVPIAQECLDHGLAVLLEKPAANSLAEAVELARSAADVDARLLVGHQRRHHPAARVAKSVLDDNRLGRLLGVNGVFALRKDANYFVQRPRGVGLVNLIHDLDLLQHFCGRLTAVSAAVSHAGRNSREEDTIALVLEFDSGVVGSMVATDSSRHRGAGIRRPRSCRRFPTPTPERPTACWAPRARWPCRIFGSSPTATARRGTTPSCRPR